MFTTETGSLIDLHRQELAQQAKTYRLMRQARARGPGIETRALIALGGLLIALGQRIQDRYGLAWSRGTGMVQLPPGRQADA